MAATRYQVEGERLDVLLSQVRRMGRTVTVLKAEKVRSGGVGGFFSREHYELLVEVEGEGEVPENFVATTKAGKKTGPVRTSAPKKTVPEAPVETEPEPSEDEVGLNALLNEARNHLTSTTEAASAMVEAELNHLASTPKENRGADLMSSLGGHFQTPPATSPEAANPATNPATSPGAVEASALTTAQAAAAVFGADTPAPRSVPTGPVQTGGLLDARLQGVAAPGAWASRPPAPARAPSTQNLGPIVSTESVLALGIPDTCLPEELLEVDAAGISEYSNAIANPVEPLKKPGAVIAVVGPAPQAAAIVDLAGRLAGRIGPAAYPILGGAKTTLPGEGQRARSADELQRYLIARPEGICVLALADSLVDAHRRSVAKLLSVVYVDQTWALVDSRIDADRLSGWMRTLPDVLKPDALAVTHVWESTRPGQVLELGVPVGMLDGVPAKGPAWQLLLEERLGQD